MTVAARGNAEFGAEGAVEVGDVIKAAVERDVEDLLARGGEAERGLTEPGAEEVAVGREAGEAFEDAEAVVGAEKNSRTTFRRNGGNIIAGDPDESGKRLFCHSSGSRFSPSSQAV
jgi:hypothetical protein